MQIWYEHMPILKKVNYYNLEVNRDNNCSTKNYIWSWQYENDLINLKEVIEKVWEEIHKQLSGSDKVYLNSIIQLPDVDIRGSN